MNAFAVEKYMCTLKRRRGGEGGDGGGGQRGVGSYQKRRSGEERRGGGEREGCKSQSYKDGFLSKTSLSTFTVLLSSAKKKHEKLPQRRVQEKSSVSMC